MKQQYSAPWDILLILITIIVVGIFVGLNIIIPGNAYIPHIINFSIVLGCASYGVYGYKIHTDTLRIQRLGWSIKIPLSEISKAEFRPDIMSKSIRLWGIGGVFGYIGHFRNRQLGNYKAYATHRKKTVVIQTTKNEQFVLSPSDPVEFVRALTSQAKN